MQTPNNVNFFEELISYQKSIIRELLALRSHLELKKRELKINISSSLISSIKQYYNDTLDEIENEYLENEVCLKSAHQTIQLLIKRKEYYANHRPSHR